MTVTAALGVAGGFIVILAFMVLGAELPRPEGLVPKGPDVASARLFSDVWGWLADTLLIGAVAIGGSVLANQDGWGRSFCGYQRLILAA
ncbi:MAG: hypothetical protein R3E54_03690 [Halioglobus sp.]